MNKGGYLQYKCRRCGVIIQNTHAPDIFIALICIMNDWETNKMGWIGMSPQKTDIHTCKNGEYGISDLVGGIEDD